MKHPPSEPIPSDTMWELHLSLIPLLESAPIAITVVSQAGAILFVNGKLEDLFGYERGELLGQPVEILMPERFRKRHRQHRVDYMGAPHMRSMGSAMDLAARRKDGSEFPIEAGLSYLQFGEQMVIMTTIIDVSRRKQTELLLEQRVEERTHELERRQRVSDGLGHIVGMLNSNQPLEAVLDHIVTQATHLLDAAACAIFRYQEHSHDLMLQVSHGFTDLALNDMSTPIRDKHLVGYVALRGKPMGIADLTQPIHTSEPALEARRQLLVDNGYRSLLTVPLLIKKEVNGCFVLYYARQRAFSEDDKELAVLLSGQAALAIENERLRTQSARTAVAAERNRLARDLHDAVTQTLFSATMIAEVLPRIWRRSEEEGMRRLDELRELTRGALAEMRTLLLELRPAKLIEVEINELLRQLAEAISSRARVPVHVIIEGDVTMPPDVKIALYRIAQEALNNVAKHAQASHVEVRLIRNPTYIELTVTDDGVGFHFETIRPEHLGLGIMRERAEDIGATLSVISKPEQGATIAVQWMYRKQTRGAEKRHSERQKQPHE